MKKIEIDNYSVSIFEGDKASPVVYCHFSAEDAEKALSFIPISQQKINLVAVEGINWDNDMSPWPAAKVFRSGNDFSGGADRYIKVLAEKIIPAAEKELHFTPTKRGIVGYSLAGLFAIYSLYKCDKFNFAASVSGSLWYDNFIQYLSVHEPLNKPDNLYFSLGDREKISKNPRMARVEECTLQAVDIFRKMGINTSFCFNKGGHFADSAERISHFLRTITH